MLLNDSRVREGKECYLSFVSYPDCKVVVCHLLLGTFSSNLRITILPCCHLPPWFPLLTEFILHSHRCQAEESSEGWQSQSQWVTWAQLWRQTLHAWRKTSAYLKPPIPGISELGQILGMSFLIINDCPPNLANLFKKESSQLHFLVLGLCVQMEVPTAHSSSRIYLCTCKSHEVTSSFQEGSFCSVKRGL